MNNAKPILAIETSGKICGACLYFNEEKYFEQKITLKHSHSDKIFEVVESVLRTGNTELNEIDAIAVSAGPGSFTGLRIGMSAAKGIALGSGLPLIPVPTFESLAFQIAAILPENTEFAVANKVNSEELYFARFQVSLNSYIFVHDLSVIKKEELPELTNNILIFGDAGKKDISVPSPEATAKWSVKFGKDLLTYDYDFLEPNYIKNFIVKGK
ncbi:MAG: tRNA (adenosine(37)-N6)-threonylcarbamoyltransferase complex dimerization subunit type 1 TsaB [Ignavibacteriales bacterium]|nr:MAG: tRNA (adenosine(37)-N6)-threonylcarbamoyltransferase complex dimerization subunit type 1 TsaB [Ignavibacteriales bacterium]